MFTRDTHTHRLAALLASAVAVASAWACKRANTNTPPEPAPATTPEGTPVADTGAKRT